MGSYAGTDGVADTMTVNEFCAMIRDAGLLGMVEAKKVFALAQKESGGGSVEDEDDEFIKATRLEAEKKKRIARGATLLKRGSSMEGLSEADEAVVRLANNVSEADGDAYDDNSLMTFSEFLAGLARIGLWKYHGDRATPAAKIGKGLDVVGDLWQQLNPPSNDPLDGDGDGMDHASVSDMTASVWG